MSQTKGRTAYEIYGDAVDWRNFMGEPMPMYEELPEKIMQAWEAVGKELK